MLDFEWDIYLSLVQSDLIMHLSQMNNLIIFDFNFEYFLILYYRFFQLI